jgi:hypothetical protein
MFKGHVAGEPRIESPQKSQEFLMPMAAEALADHFALQRFQRRKQTGRAVALVIVGHRAQTPFLLRHAPWLAGQCGPDDRLDLVGRVGGLAATPRSNLPQAFRASLGKTRALQCHGLHIDRYCGRNPKVRLAGRSGQHDPATQRHLLRRRVRSHPLLQLLLISTGNLEQGAGSGRAPA